MALLLLRTSGSRGNGRINSTSASCGRRDAWRASPRERTRPAVLATRCGERAFSNRPRSSGGGTHLSGTGGFAQELRVVSVLPVSQGTTADRTIKTEGGGGHESPWMSRSRVLSFLGMTAFGCGALVAANHAFGDATARTEGIRESNSNGDKQKANTTKDKTVTATPSPQTGSGSGSPSPRSGGLTMDGSPGRERLLISTAAVRGDRSRMEDTSFVSDCTRFNAVFDGHGGAAVAEFLKTNLFPLVSPELKRLDAITTKMDKDAVRTAIHEVLQKSMNKVDADVLLRPEWKFQGSTAVGVVLYEDGIFSFNVGDSRAVLSRGGATLELTRDHKPNDPVEKQRVEELGGTVKWYGYVDAEGEPIEPYGAYRVNGNLAVSRAIGDRDLRPFVCGDVEIKHFDRDFDKDEFIVIASDGLWDVFTSDEAVTFVHDVLRGELGGRESWRSGGHSDTSVPIFEWSHQYKSDRGMIKAARARRKTQIANYLVQEALFRGTSDNVSVIVVWLK